MQKGSLLPQTSKFQARSMAQQDSLELFPPLAWFLVFVLILIFG